MSEILDSKMNSSFNEGNLVDHPDYYNNGNIECIDAMVASKGWFKTAIFCECNDFKYNWRVGYKNPVMQELGKMAWYISKAKKLWMKAFKWFSPTETKYYAIIQLVKIKDPKTGVTKDAVLYTDGKEMLVSTLEEFNDEFKLEENE